MPGSSSRRAPPASRRGWPSATARRPRSSTPKLGSSSPTSPCGPATGYWPGSRWRSTPPVRRCGWRGGTAPASYRRRVPSYRPAWTSVRGWSRSGSPPCRPCRPWRRSGPSKRSTTSACSSSAARRARRSWPNVWPSRVVRCGTRTGRRKPPWSPVPRSSPVRARCASGCRWTAGTSRWWTSAARSSRWARPASWSSVGWGWPGTWTRPRTPRSSCRCRRPAGRARTAAVTWCGPSRLAWCSSVAPTSRSSWAAGGSSWVRSTRRCTRCRASPGRRPRCATHVAATRSWWGTSRRPPRAPSTRPMRSPGCGWCCPPRWCR